MTLAVDRMGITPRRKAQLKANGIDTEKIGCKVNEILKNLSDDGYTLLESEYLVVMMNEKIEKLKRRSPGTKISEINYQPQ